MRTSMRFEAPSMPTSAYDPGLLREQETPLVIGKNWFLDHEISAGCFVRIQDSSQVWEERVDETTIITTEGLTACLDPERGKRRTNGSNMGEPCKKRKEKLAGRVEHDARLGRVVQVRKRGGGNLLI